MWWLTDISSPPGAPAPKASQPRQWAANLAAARTTGCWVGAMATQKQRPRSSPCSLKHCLLFPHLSRHAGVGRGQQTVPHTLMHRLHQRAVRILQRQNAPLLQLRHHDGWIMDANLIGSQVAPVPAGEQRQPGLGPTLSRRDESAAGADRLPSSLVEPLSSRAPCATLLPAYRGRLPNIRAEHEAFRPVCVVERDQRRTCMYFVCGACGQRQRHACSTECTGPICSPWCPRVAV